MQVLIRKLTKSAYRSGSFISGWRSQRMRDFVKLVRPPSGARILDLGGTAFNWNLIEHDFRVTLLNLPEDPTDSAPTPPDDRYERIEGDACDLRNLYGDSAFDVVFSNSVIEHVGPDPQQARFRDEVLRLAPAHWIQTPSDRFPVEVHTGVPFYFRLPQPLINRMHRGWKRDLPKWYEMISNTRVLSRRRMCELFPTSQVYLERRLLLEKSYAFYQPYSS